MAPGTSPSHKDLGLTFAVCAKGPGNTIDATAPGEGVLMRGVKLVAAGLGSIPPGAFVAAMMDLTAIRSGG